MEKEEKVKRNKLYGNSIIEHENITNINRKLTNYLKNKLKSENVKIIYQDTDSYCI